MGDTGDPARADHEATAWLIRLQENPADRELRADFHIWLDANPANAIAWAETERLSRAIAEASRKPPSDQIATAVGSLHSLDEARARRTARRSVVRRVFDLSAAAVAACLLLLGGPDLLLRLRADAVAGTGELKTVRLADGSTIRLAPGGAIAVDFADHQRGLRLLRGDIYLDIARDPKRPFTIVAGNTRTAVLGTAFEVRKQDAGAAVAVRHGLVRASCDDGSVAELLSAGQAVDLECGVAASRSTLAPARIAAWADGRLVAQDQPMRAVIDALRPWYRGLVVTQGAGIDRRRVTGVYNLRDPQGALDALAAAHHARVRQVTPWITIISAD
jgi:transmembrane sensor